jgi:hypothetical protein
MYEVVNLKSKIFIKFGDDKSDIFLPLFMANRKIMKSSFKLSAS